MNVTKTVTSPLRSLLDFGQSVWLDYIRRDLMTGGGLRRLIDEDGLRGMTSNPAIFEKAITGGDLYDDTLAAIRADGVSDPKAVYERLAIEDIRMATDLMRPVYEATRAGDGFVSLEVSPRLARDTAATLDEARRLWTAVDRPNLMIKVPGTPAGLPAIRQLLSEGINVNVTLLFARAVYEQVARAYIDAVQERVSRGDSVDTLASVASFFISRIDTKADAAIEAKLRGASDAERRTLESLLGTVAIANGRLTYQRYLELFGSDEWKRLAAAGARPQRVLWASTSTKNPKYRDVMYVEELIGRDTVNTIPPETLDAFRDHGRVRASLTEGVDDARATLDRLAGAGISLDRITDELLDEGVRKFVEPFDALLEAIAAR